MTKWDLLQECKVGLTLKESTSVIHYNNRIKTNPHDLIKHRKSIWQIPTFFYDKNIQQTRMKMELNMIKCISEKSTTYIILNGERLDTSPLTLGARQECSLLPLPFNIVLDNRARKWNKTYGVKLSLFTDGMILHIGKPKESAKKLLELIKGYSKFAKGVQQNQYTKINCIFVHVQWKIQKWN